MNIINIKKSNLLKIAAATTLMASLYADILAAPPEYGTNLGDSIALGRDSSSDQKGVAIGVNSTSSASISIGTNAKSGFLAVAIGDNSSATHHSSISIGNHSSANANSSIAIGNAATIDGGSYNLAIGSDANSKGFTSISLGTQARSEAQESIAVGTQAFATNINSIAIGTTSNSSKEYSIAIGAGAVANIDRGIAIGLGSNTTVDAGVTGYNVGTSDHRSNTYTGLTGSTATSTLAGLSIGGEDMYNLSNGRGLITRQINNLAAGTLDTDAVNVAQLRNVNLKIKGDSTESNSDILLDSQDLTITGSNGLTTKASGQTINVSIDSQTRKLIDESVQRDTFNTTINELRDTDGLLKNKTDALEQKTALLEKESQVIGSGAAALASLKPLQFDPLKRTQIMAGIGHYRSEQSFALGVAHYANEDTLFHLGTSLGHHYQLINGGITYKFGKSSELKSIPMKYRGGPISSIYVMQDEIKELQDEVKALKEMVKQLSSKI